MALRLNEAGVRVVQGYSRDGQPWDSHDDVMTQKDHAERSDGPIASLIEDLKLRGMLDETLPCARPWRWRSNGLAGTD